MAEVEEIGRIFRRLVIRPAGKQEFLFPAAASVLFKYIQDYKTMRPSEFQSILANCRLVCREWNKGVENYVTKIEDHLEVAPEVLPEMKIKEDVKLDDQWEAYKYPAHLHHFLTVFNSFEGTHDVDAFQNHFDLTHWDTDKNPFVGRNVELDLSVRFDWDFVKGMRKLLWKYGHQIWYLHVHIHDCIPFDRLKRFGAFRGFMESMPNLKVLTIHVTSNKEPLPVYEKIFDVFPPYPEMESIKTFDLPECVLDGLRERNENVRVFKVTNSEEDELLSIGSEEELDEKAQADFFSD